MSGKKKTIEVAILKNGIRIGTRRLTRDEFAAAVRKAVEERVMHEFLSPQPEGTLRSLCEELTACEERGDLAGATAAYAALTRHLGERLGLQPAPRPLSERVPTTDGLVAALESGGEVVAGFPLESHNAHVAVEDFTRAAGQVARFEAFHDVLDAALRKCSLNLAVAAQRGDELVRRLAAVIAPEVAGNEELAVRSAPLRAYVDLPVARAQETKRLLDRDRERTRAQVEGEVLETARDQARAELRSRIDDKIASLLSE